MTGKVRTRFAPSPTGYMHIGNLRTALFAYLIAKKNNGTFILRIEDTDRERYIAGSEQVIYETLRVTGLLWDEGPMAGGSYGPYIQSERKDSYLEYAEMLVEKGDAYYCFCSKERLAESKEKDENSMYDRTCRDLSKDRVKMNLADGMSFVIRQKMPDTGSTSYQDLVYGRIDIDNCELEDQILIKSDGMPTYNFANVIDDHLMDITHIVRGNEYLTSTPKYSLLYEAYGWEKPEYIHLPLVMKSSTEKLSKRNGTPSVLDLITEGFLPDTIINFTALLGWSPGTTQEIFSLEELIESFEIEHINRSPSIFDKNKLLWMNGEYIKKLGDGEFLGMALPYLRKYIKRDADLVKVASLLHKRINIFTDIEGLVDFIDIVPLYDKSLYINQKMKTDESVSLNALKLAFDMLSSLIDFTNSSLFSSLSELAKNCGLKNSQILWPIRTALTGKETSPGGATEIAEMLGKKETLVRISDAISLLTE